MFDIHEVYHYMKYYETFSEDAILNVLQNLIQPTGVNIAVILSLSELEGEVSTLVTIALE